MERLSVTRKLKAQVLAVHKPTQQQHRHHHHHHHRHHRLACVAPAVVVI